MDTIELRGRVLMKLPRWNPDLAAATTALAFGLVVWWLYATVSQAGAFQQRVRAAQSARAAVLRTQLDEETGLRGFTSTGRAVFLQPYHNAVAMMEQRLTAQAGALEALGVDLPQSSADATRRERALNGLWVARVAQPLIANRTRPDAIVLALEGKELVDRFRAHNDALGQALLQVSRDADEALAAALRRIVFAGLAGAVVIVALVSLLTRAGERMRRAAEEQRRLYANEKRIADTLQQAFLQRSLPALPSLGMHAVYMPAEQQASVGGDWYDAVQLPNGKLFATVGDVAGHGIDAAVVMSRARQTLVALAMLGNGPAEILDQVNRILIAQGQTMVTAACCLVDLATSEVEYAMAGHPSPVLVEPGAPPRLLGEHHGIPLGVVAGARYTPATFTPRGGSLLVLYTDGLIEYKRDVLSGESRLLRAAQRVAEAGVPDPAVALRDEVFRDGNPVDDVAVLTLRFAARSPGERDDAPATSINALQVTRISVGVPRDVPSSREPGARRSSPERRSARTRRERISRREAP